MAKKRNFRVLSGQSNYRPWKEWEKGDTFVGQYVRSAIDQFKNPTYFFKSLEVEFEDKEAEEKFAPGNMVNLNSVGVLDNIMGSGEVEIGNIVRVVYNGKSKMTRGDFKGTEAHSIEVSVADDGDGSSFEQAGEEEDDLSGL